MISRTLYKSVIFSGSFQLPDFESPLPAGIYEVETEEEVLEDDDHLAPGWTATRLRIQGGRAVERRPVDPAHLDAAWERDQKVVQAAVIPPISGRWVSLWVRNTPSDGRR
ncbi:hypothetical protein NUH86_17805 [Sphingobium sp. JS3065]|jgi:hypothetical protein|uniref:hypothetical protein n=1 Tax=Sphingobium sp. JS3065 TaxID=2970925 RepID=UPI00226523DA|nr:hypothetical protein [Sphingobium sp. JS3065]UZW57442.1 hypothetical protein NUH86_17805 [Sphingobium sp. JS3065]